MESKGSLTINLTLDWRSLAIPLLIMVLLFVAYTNIRAQGDASPNTNEAQTEQANATAQENPEAVIYPAEIPEGDQVYTTNGEWISSQDVDRTPAQPEEISAVTGGVPGSGHFYLTNANFTTLAAPTACAAGYHMASLWEILDVSNLTYDYNHPAAHKKADSGYGPPSYWYGWVRTGWSSASDNVTGTGNCSNWTSNSNSVYGVSTRLSRTWETAPGDIQTWDATSFTCNFTGPVWCVKD